MVIAVLEKLAPKKIGIVLFWIIFWMVQSVLMSGGELVALYLVKNIAIVGLQLLVVIINVHVLYPLLFAQKKYVAYIFISLFLIYLVFSFSFFFIELALSFTPVPFDFPGIRFSTDFWIILSGSSFYSLALVCSTLYKLMETNQEKDKVNQQLLYVNQSTETKYLDLKERLNNSNKILTIREGNKKHLVPVTDIYYIKGLKEYVVWHTKYEKIVTLDS